MISPEQRARIRRLFYAEHWKVGTIATELGLHHETVSRALSDDRVVGRTEPRVVASVLDPYSPSSATYSRSIRGCGRLGSSTIRERGYAGSEVVVRR